MPLLPRGLAVLLGVCLTGVVAASVPAVAAPADAPDPLATLPTATAHGLLFPEEAPPGANDWACRPSSAHPEPVVLVHGTFGNSYQAWRYMAPEIARAGHCVFTLNYGAGRGDPVKGTGDIRASARELARFVDHVRDVTGARQVSIVGHSQGGMMPRWYLRREGGADLDDPSRNKVARLVSLAATHHGTSISGVMTITSALGVAPAAGALLGEAVEQQAAGSSFMNELNREGDTVPGVHYTALATRYDVVATPYQGSFLTAGPGATVRNILLQDGCPLDLTDHVAITYDPRALHFVLNALDPARAATPEGRAAPCPPFAPAGGVPLTQL
ncbi:alpha/beta fold hydrolase [Spongiactinospora sp. TRM90649]|uniref:esterase/lipase family protein n=1 Tax=Spongiactinospora sp. TRM90649 TaxID=3031114 RepID=UPI0023F9FDB4|nr:alpha/beta fold hydrolase [Spongiactinospora sp. TRM90649]MDF5752498.1 alpha/beta fold hydrolase [Spongiactinospora sp. TRM90649]